MVSHTDRQVHVVEARSSWKVVCTLVDAYFLLGCGSSSGEGRRTVVSEPHVGVGAHRIEYVDDPRCHHAA